MFLTNIWSYLYIDYVLKHNGLFGIEAIIIQGQFQIWENQ